MFVTSLVSACAGGFRVPPDHPSIDPRPELDRMFARGPSTCPRAALLLAMHFGEFDLRHPELARQYVSMHIDDRRTLRYASSPGHDPVLPVEILLMGLFRKGSADILTSDGEISDVERAFLINYTTFQPTAPEDPAEAWAAHGLEWAWP